MVYASKWSTIKTLPLQSCRNLNKKCLAVIFSILLLTLGISSPLWNITEHLLSRQSKNYAGLEEEEDFRLTTAEQVHLALGPTPSQMTIVWATKAYTRSWILYGYDTDSLNMKQAGKVEYVERRNKHGTPYWHQVLLSGLVPGHSYFYRIKSGKHISRPFRFTTLRAGHDWFPQFMVYSDLGSKTQALEQILKEGRTGNYDAILHVGDIAYNLGSDHGRVGDYFLGWLQSIAAEVPYMTCPGDHEAHDKFWHYSFRFSMPGTPWPMPPNYLWYSSDIGNVHLISYNTEDFFYDSHNIQAQLDWLVSDLEQANQKRAQIPWIIVMGHMPLYCSYARTQDCNNPNSILRAAVEEMFHVYGVDLYISGHLHTYERTWPVYRDKAMSQDYNNPRGIVQVISGTTGSHYHIDPVNTLVRNSWSGFLMSRREWESVGHLTILNDTHLLWEEVMAKSQKVIDKFVIVQTKHGSFGNLTAFRRKYFLYSYINILLGITPGPRSSVALIIIGIVVFKMNKRWGFIAFRAGSSMGDANSDGRKVFNPAYYVEV